MAIPYAMRPMLARMPVEAQMSVRADYDRRSKSMIFAYATWLFLGWHYLYLRRVGLQFAFWFTIGGLGLWWLVDLFRVGPMINRLNEDLARDLILQYGSIYRDNREPSPVVVNYASGPPIQLDSPVPTVSPFHQDVMIDASRRRLPVVLASFLILISVSTGIWVLATHGGPVQAETSGDVTVMTTARDVNVREEPFPSSAVQGIIQGGNIVEGTFEKGRFNARRWLHISSGQFKGGYISVANLKST